jgi:cyclase
LGVGRTPHQKHNLLFSVRVVPCLDVRDGLVVKGIQFQNIKEAGLPDERAKL